MRFEPPAGLDLEQRDVREGYAAWAPHYDRMLTDTADGAILERFLRLLPKRDRHRLLDIGCGTGRNLLWLRDHGLQLDAVGFDTSPEMLAYARAKGLYRELHEASFPPLREQFDLITAILMTCHLADIGAFYRYAADSLAKDGHLIVIDMHPHLFHLGKGTFVPIDGRILAIENHLHEISAHVAAAHRAGLRLVDLAEQHIPEAWALRSGQYASLIGQPLSVGFLWSRNP